MSEELTLPIILPVGAILFEVLFLITAIPIEATVLHKWLKFDKKTSTFYAICTNVFSSVIGWLVFFSIEPILAIEIKSQLINYVLFNKLKDPSIQTMIVFTSSAIFFGTFLVKFLLLKLLIIFLNETKKEEQTTVMTGQERAAYLNINKVQNTKLVLATLVANSLSYTAITALLLLRSR